MTVLKSLRVLTLLIAAIPFVTYSQTDLDAATSELATIETATTTETAATTTGAEPEIDTKWFETERIFGNVDVGDFVVGPGRIEISADVGETVVTYMTVTNRISDGRTFRLEVADITGTSDGSSALQLVEDGTGPYNMTNLVSFKETEFTLNLGERARIPVTITVPPNATPGGYYGSVLVSTIRTGTGEQTQNPIIARVGSHIFLTVGGEQRSDGRTTGFTTLPTQSVFTRGPIEFGISYNNAGTVHLNPYGLLRIENTFGTEVGLQELEPWFVLPSAVRTREVTWEREWLFGRYTATAQINRGYEDIVDEYTIHFWVIPWQFLIGFGVLLFTLILLVLIARHRNRVS
jgi:hypothetical protein